MVMEIEDYGTIRQVKT